MKLRRTRTASRTAGWSLLEVVIVSVLAVTIFGKTVHLMNSAARFGGEQSSAMFLEDQGRLVMDRIATAIMGSDRDTLIPTVESIHNSGVRYRYSFGVEAGEVVWSDVEEISLTGGQEVQWRQRPDEADEQRVSWTKLVQPLLAGEELNGVDDNGNGLVDEEGLSFELDGEGVTIRLTLRRMGPNGVPFTQTMEKVVTCRN